jgi:hypothetical protein
MRFKKLERIFFMPNFALSTNGNGRRQAIFELLRQTTAGGGSGEEKISRESLTYLRTTRMYTYINKIK